VQGKVVQVSCGPSITCYEFQPAPGVKVSRVVNLTDDIALSLAAAGVRIEAPIPGKAAIGIEVPNQEIATVSLREVIETEEFQTAQSKLTVALGKDISGKPILADLSKMPHLLIAGATGSGKSVCMNALITSILFKAKPSEVKFLMVDPKMVELTTYNGIPHLISPVVTDAKKAASALRWAVHEMENRYELFAAAGVKDINRYNQQIIENNINIESLPYIVVLIDELADLMMVAPADVEDAICRLAQMARAAGIHLVVATQRPSVDVITGIIKANIPSRIAFAVSSQTDSRTILDMNGAEKLLGRGDMLFYPTGYPKPVRLQGVFVSDKDVEEVVRFLKQQEKPVYNEEVVNQETELDKPKLEEEDDELIPEVAKIFIENGQASISLIQRRFRVGYNRAARIIDIMEKKGIIGGYEGSKPRQVLITVEDYERLYGNY
jgi:S-DNA-T family DNA segregation ATPase FtsK/SpoIIIE